MSTVVDPHVIGEHIRRLRPNGASRCVRSPRETGFSASFISQLENGQVAPSLGSTRTRSPRPWASPLGEFFAAAETGEELRSSARTSATA